MNDLATLKEGWDRAAREDAMFNIVTLPQYANGGWRPEEFFAHGQAEIDEMLAHLDELGLRGARREWALDFGCGVGRLTQALIPEYEHAMGVDVSAEMVNLAREHNRHAHRCLYANTGARLLDDIAPAGFDLIYSRITLQHMLPELQQGYVQEFVQLLAPQGLAVFQIPDGPDYVHENSWLSMHGVPRATVEDWVEQAGGDLVDVELLPDPGMWLCWRYTVRA